MLSSLVASHVSLSRLPLSQFPIPSLQVDTLGASVMAHLSLGPEASIHPSNLCAKIDASSFLS